MTFFAMLKVSYLAERFCKTWYWVSCWFCPCKDRSWRRLGVTARPCLVFKVLSCCPYLNQPALRSSSVTWQLLRFTLAVSDDLAKELSICETRSNENLHSSTKETTQKFNMKEVSKFDAWMLEVHWAIFFLSQICFWISYVLDVNLPRGLDAVHRCMDTKFHQSLKHRPRHEDKHETWEGEETWNYFWWCHSHWCKMLERVDSSGIESLKSNGWLLVVAALPCRNMYFMVVRSARSSVRVLDQ